MNEFIRLSRFRQKCMESIYKLSEIDAYCQKLTIDVTQENIDKIAKLAEQYQNSNYELQNYLMDFLKESTQAESEDELSTTETDDGYIL